MNPTLEPLLKLGRTERLQLVEDLWDSIVRESPNPDVESWKLEELRRRKASFEQNPDSGRTWEQVQRRARALHD